MLNERKREFDVMLPPAIKSMDPEKMNNCIAHVLKLYGIE